jgi:hypothetical protein
MRIKIKEISSGTCVKDVPYLLSLLLAIHQNYDLLLCITSSHWLGDLVLSHVLYKKTTQVSCNDYKIQIPCPQTNLSPSSTSYPNRS